jgi:hypothetical protein
MQPKHVMEQNQGNIYHRETVCEDDTFHIDIYNVFIKFTILIFANKWDDAVTQTSCKKNMHRPAARILTLEIIVEFLMFYS